MCTVGKNDNDQKDKKMVSRVSGPPTIKER